jgi:sodium/bile acid cotransporter 7
MISPFLRRNWFLLGILLVIAIGAIEPSIGVTLGFGSVTRTIIVILLFLIAGFTLPSESILSGLKNVRLHLFIQIFIFVVHPLYYWLVTLLFAPVIPVEIRTGILALAVLPTTVSSCIVFTQSAEGNTVAAMFNAALANVAAIIVSPLLLSLLLQATDFTLPAGELANILRKLALNMLLPILVGQLLRRKLAAFAVTHKKRLGVVSNSLILGIIFLTFSQTASDPEFVAALDRMILPFIVLALGHILMLAIVYASARGIFRFGRDDTVAVLFVAPQKTLAMGAPLLSVYFASAPQLLGFALLPLIFYHMWQLMVAGFMKSLPLMRVRRTQG